MPCHAHSNVLNCSPTLKWHNEDNKASYPANVEHFVIVEGTKAVDVINPSLLKNSAPIAEVAQHKVSIYELPGFTLCVSEEKDLNYFASITDLLKPWLDKAKLCSIISMQSISEYKTDADLDYCTIRSINSQFKDIPKLEVPNFITGVSAGVGTLRKVLELPFSCYVVYVDLLDVFTIKGVLNLLKRIGLVGDESVTVKGLHHKSDLYM